MALLPMFDTPASLRDAPAGSPFYTAWSNFIATRTSRSEPRRQRRRLLRSDRNRREHRREQDAHLDGLSRATCCSPAIATTSRPPTPRPMPTWPSRNPQNEYFEWYVERNRAGKITKLTFVTETPEYYQTLWNTDPALVVTLYRALVNPAVVQADLQTGTALQQVQSLEHSGRHRPLHSEHQHARRRAWPGTKRDDPRLRHFATTSRHGPRWPINPRRSIHECRSTCTC